MHLLFKASYWKCLQSGQRHGWQKSWLFYRLSPSEKVHGTWQPRYKLPRGTHVLWHVTGTPWMPANCNAAGGRAHSERPCKNNCKNEESYIIEQYAHGSRADFTWPEVSLPLPPPPPPHCVLRLFIESRFESWPAEVIGGGCLCVCVCLCVYLCVYVWVYKSQVG